MICLKPFRQGVMEFGCGQCLPCRVNRRRVWTARLVLEAALHTESRFVTLTYDEDHYPEDGSVSPRALQLYLKRLRRAVSPNKVRFFGCGEYGTHTFRPHYHVCLFGTGDEGAIRDCWTLGFVHVGDLSTSAAAYACGYVVKKMTGKDDARLQGRHPEFVRMSLRPGIGAGADRFLFGALVDRDGVIRFDRDVPGVIRHEGQFWSVGRYIRSRLRKAFGGDGRMPEAELEARARELQDELWTLDSRIRREEERVQHGRNVAARNRIRESKRGLSL